MSYTDELEAEKAVNRSLLKELKRRKPVSQYLKLADGRFVKTEDYVEVSRDEVLSAIEKQRMDAAELEVLIAEPAEALPESPVETPVGAVPTDTPELSPEERVAEIAGATPEQPATVEVNGQDVTLNADGTIVVDTTPEEAVPAEPITPPAPAVDPVAEAAGVTAAEPTQTPQPENTAAPTPVVLQ